MDDSKGLDHLERCGRRRLWTEPSGPHDPTAVGGRAGVRHGASRRESGSEGVADCCVSLPFGCLFVCFFGASCSFGCPGGGCGVRSWAERDGRQGTAIAECEYKKMGALSHGYGFAANLSQLLSARFAISTYSLFAVVPPHHIYGRSVGQPRTTLAQESDTPSRQGNTSPNSTARS